METGGGGGAAIVEYVAFFRDLRKGYRFEIATISKEFRRGGEIRCLGGIPQGSPPFCMNPCNVTMSY